MAKNKRTEAQVELERMFGHEDEADIGIGDSLRLRMVQRQYKRSNLLYKMFFDKQYR